MGLLDKFKKKAAHDEQGAKIRQDQREISIKQEQVKKDLTLAELQEKKSAKTIKTKSDSGKVVVKKVKKEDTKMAYKYLVKPLVTEKGTYLMSENKYLFEVAKNSDKTKIKKAIEAVYGVKPVKVNIIKLSGKKVRHGKVSGKTKDKKKAIVTLKQGETIEVYEGV